MKLYSYILLYFLLCFTINAQENSITITAKLNSIKSILYIKQVVNFTNTSNNSLNNIYFHNWANAYKNNKTPLAKRFIDDYELGFHFAKKQQLGFSTINTITINNEKATYKALKNKPDVFKVYLPKKLPPLKTITIHLNYQVKIPDAKFSKYGKTKNGYHLRFWHILPAVYNGKWQLMNNLNLDDLYQNYYNYNIKLLGVNSYYIESNLNTSKKGDVVFLDGKTQKDIQLIFTKKNNFKSFKANNLLVKTDFLNKNLTHKTTEKIITQQVNFIEEFLGKYPYKKILIDKTTANKYALYSAFNVPSILNPYTREFPWEVRFFNALSTKFIENSLNFNQRKSNWLPNGLQTFIMMEYINKYHPNKKVLGKYAKIWGLKTYQFSKLKYNDKYPFVYEFSSRKFYDQALTTQTDSLSNFNRKVVSKYKAGMGLGYLKSYMGDTILKETITKFYANNKLKFSNANTFKTYLKEKTAKDLSWFFGDFITTNKKIDYTIKKVIPKKDSIQITIKNKRNITVPVKLYGLKNDSIIYSKWLKNIDSSKIITIKNQGIETVALNYNKDYPEYNVADNFKKIKKSILNKPLQIRFFKDAHNPRYNQLFFDPDIRYNLYDGILLGARFHNKPLLERDFELIISPKYGFKSNSLTGNFSAVYNQYFEDSKVYKIEYGVGGSYFHYKKNLSYTSFTPFVRVQLKRKRLRDVGKSGFITSLTYIDKETDNSTTTKTPNKYSVLNLSYFYSKPDLLKGVQLYTNTEISSNFMKVNADFRFRKYISKNQRFYFRLFSGLFIYNNTKNDFFSYDLDRGNDYLFRFGLYGRSESSGFFSQQYIVNDGGFKSKLNNSLINNALISANTSIGIWRWVEFYNDAAFYQNKGLNTQFAYENGIRLNFVEDILELYFPIYNNQSKWEIIQATYPSKIRFTFTANLNAIYDFIRRGFL